IVSVASTIPRPLLMLWMAPPPARECQGYGRRLRLPRFGLWRGHGYRANRPNTWPLRPPLHWYTLAFAGSCCLHLYTVSFKGRGLLESWRPSGPVSRSIVGDLGHFQSRLADTDHAGLERQFRRPQDEAAGSFQTKPAFPSTATAGSGSPAER